MVRGTFAVVAALVAGLGSAACSGNAGANGGPSPASNTTMVEVTNNNWADMVVYLRSNGMRQRLGTVTSMRSERLRISAAMLPNTEVVQLEADPIGNYRSYVSDPIMVTRGGTLVWRIEATPSLSYLIAR